MCGIWSFIGKTEEKDIPRWFEDFMKIKHRGPMYSSFQQYKDLLVGFHRLSIMDLTFQSNQPYVEGNRVFICNGEIYNYEELNQRYDLGIPVRSDCLALLRLYTKNTFSDFLSLMKEVKGEFAFLLFEFNESNELTQVLAGRDTIGVRPLYYGYHELDSDSDDFNLIFSSEIKGCGSFQGKIKEFPPGNICKIDLQGNDGNLFAFSTLYDTIPRADIPESQYLKAIRESVIQSVHARLDADQPAAFLLSGGVDSSLVAALASLLLKEEEEEEQKTIRIKTFCCGMAGGSDLAYARKVADHIGSQHTEVLFTAEEALAAIDDVIYTTETWDVTTIRASVGQYLVSKYISENTNAKVVFVGEGPDEVCSSYLFNWYARLPKDIHPVAMEYVKNIHYYDVKRADRCIARWGLEARVALLDPAFIESYWLLPSEWRHPAYKGIEKYWLRKAFENDAILPEEVLWRKKEAFSDQCGRSFVVFYCAAAYTKDIWYDRKGVLSEKIRGVFWREKHTYRTRLLATQMGSQWECCHTICRPVGENAFHLPKIKPNK